MENERPKIGVGVCVVRVYLVKGRMLTVRALGGVL
jgi:hypothetical protein